MPDVLMFADTFRSPELRHEVPLGIPDPFLYVERDGIKHIQISSMEAPRLQALGLHELHPSEDYGVDELIASGLSHPEVRAELASRAVKSLGVSQRGRAGDVSALARRPSPVRRCRAVGRQRASSTAGAG